MIAQSIAGDCEAACGYILITPAKNEDDNLPLLIQSIVHQTLQPIAWAIVDDGSEDKTCDIIEQACRQYGWIHLLRLEGKSQYDLGEHLASVIRQGFDYLLDHCGRNNLHFGYIALSDADTTYPEDYFCKLVSFLRMNSEFGIISGRVVVKGGRARTYEESRVRVGDGMPYGTGRIWTKAAFCGTGGIPTFRHWDAVSTARAVLRGWKVRVMSAIECYQLRDTGGKFNLWGGYSYRGRGAYYLGVSPIGLLNTIIDLLIVSRERRSVTKSLAFASGYVKSWLQRSDRLEDDDVRRYFASNRRMMMNYWLFVKGVLRRRYRGDREY